MLHVDPHQRLTAPQVLFVSNIDRFFFLLLVAVTLELAIYSLLTGSIIKYPIGYIFVLYVRQHFSL